jgi:hypothetical protein
MRKRLILSAAIAVSALPVQAELHSNTGPLSVAEGDSAIISLNADDDSANITVVNKGEGVQEVLIDSQNGTAEIITAPASAGMSGNVTFQAIEKDDIISTFTYELGIRSKVVPESTGLARVNGVCDIHPRTGDMAGGGEMHFSFNPNTVDTIYPAPDGSPNGREALSTTRVITLKSVLVNGYQGPELDFKPLFDNTVSTMWASMASSLGITEAVDLIGLGNNYGSVSQRTRGVSYLFDNKWTAYDIHGDQFSMTWDSDRGGVYEYNYSTYDSAEKKSVSYQSDGTFYCSYSAVLTDDVAAEIEDVNTMITENGANLTVQERARLYGRLTVAHSIADVDAVRTDAITKINAANIRAKRVQLLNLIDHSALNQQPRQKLRSRIIEATTLSELQLIEREIQLAIDGFNAELSKKIVWIQATLDRTSMSDEERARIQARIDAITEGRDMIGLRNEIRQANEKWLEGERLSDAEMLAKLKAVLRRILDYADLKPEDRAEILELLDNATTRAELNSITKMIDAAEADAETTTITPPAPAPAPNNDVGTKPAIENSGAGSFGLLGLAGFAFFRRYKK